jgi:cytochrome b subunit of formate dehydrogenase
VEQSLQVRVWAAARELQQSLEMFPMLTTPGRKQSNDETDKAWFWIVGTVTLVLLLIGIVFYSRDHDCSPLGAPPEIGLLVCAQAGS